MQRLQLQFSATEFVIFTPRATPNVGVHEFNVYIEDRRPTNLGKFQMAISLELVVRSTSCLIPGRVFGDGRSNGPTSSCTKSKIQPPAILENLA